MVMMKNLSWEPLQQKKYHKKSERRLNSFRLPVETLKDPTATIQEDERGNPTVPAHDDMSSYVIFSMFFNHFQ